MAVKQPIQAHADSQHAPRPRRHARRLVFCFVARQERPQHPPAVHRKGRNQIERRQNQVGFRDPFYQVGVARHNKRDHRADRLVLCKKIRKQCDADQQIYNGACCCDPEFLRCLRGPLQPRDTSDRKHHDLQRPDSLPRPNNRVREFVRQYRRKQRDQIDRIVKSRLVTAQTCHHQKDQKQDKREVQPYWNAHQPERPERSGRSSSRVRALFWCQI